MGVSVTPLDGQNVGLRLLGQTTVQPLSLNLSTGEVQSAYFSETDLEILQRFALRLFQVVPYSSRAAGAIGLLQRLCAVSPADESVLTLTATVASGVATLTAEVDFSPASLILTIPYSASGGVMPSSGGSSGGGGGTDSNLIQVEGYDLSPGILVWIDPATGIAEEASAADPAKMPCVGIVDSVVNASTISVRTGGAKTAMIGLTPGKIYFVGVGGLISISAPTTPGHIVQPIGFSMTSSILAMAPSTALTVR